MTKIIIGKDCIEISGHSPDPVVCHGISAVSQMVANYVTDNAWGIAKIGDGFLNISVFPAYAQEHLIMALISALEDIADEYPDNIEITYET